MNHITQEQARELAEKSGFFFQDVGYSPTLHAMPLEYSQKCFERLCNAAIEWYIDKSITELTLTPQEVNDLAAQAALQHEPENEPAVSLASQAAIEPVAYFDFQEHGFYWAPNVKIGEVPVIRKVAPLPLYSEPDMYKSEQKTNTSQERVKKSEKSEQVPLTDAQCDKVLQRIDEWATGYGAQEYGLPLFWMPNRARDVLREALGGKV